MVAVFGGFAVDDLATFQQMGFGLAGSRPAIARSKPAQCASRNFGVTVMSRFDPMGSELGLMDRDCGRHPSQGGLRFLSRTSPLHDSSRLALVTPTPEFDAPSVRDDAGRDRRGALA